MELADLGGFLRDLARDIADDLEDAEAVSVAELEQAAVANSEGRLTYRELAKLGHPYAKRRVALNPNVVNRHHRTFVGGWDSEGPRASQGGLTSTVWNDSEVAAFFEDGTDRMVPRHPEHDAADRLEERRANRLGHAVDRNLE